MFLIASHPPGLSCVVTAPMYREGVAGVEIGALRDEGERRYLGPGGRARLVSVAPANAKGATVLFIHGFTGDPANQEVLIQRALSHGMSVYVMAYNSVGRRASANSRDFADEFKRLAGSGIEDVTIVAHSLGAMTAKAALDRLTGVDGRLKAFKRVSFVAIATPWEGIPLARVAWALLPHEPSLAFARDLSAGSRFVRQLCSLPLAPEVRFYDLQGDLDPVAALKDTRQGHAAFLNQAVRAITMRGVSHNTVLWDHRTLRFALDPQHQTSMGTAQQPAPLKVFLDETAAVLGLPGAFRGQARWESP